MSTVELCWVLPCHFLPFPRPLAPVSRTSDPCVALLARVTTKGKGWHLHVTSYLVGSPRRSPSTLASIVVCRLGAQVPAHLHVSTLLTRFNCINVNRSPVTYK